VTTKQSVSALVVTLVLIAVMVPAFLVLGEWSRRAADMCGFPEYKPASAATASGWSIDWDMSEFAYVCEYDAPGRPRKRMGFTEVF
jgi:hypothetical protein